MYNENGARSIWEPSVAAPSVAGSKASGKHSAKAKSEQIEPQDTIGRLYSKK